MDVKNKTLSALLQRSTIDNHDEVLKTCNTGLKASKGDLEFLYVRVIALLKLERYDDALAAVEEGGNQLKERTKVERAYALYKTGQLKAAKELAKSIIDNRGARHIEAQASYRSEDFSNASAIYKLLVDENESEENDIRINSSATDANLEWSKQGDLVERKRPSREDLELYETAYNAACASIARGELQQGNVLLKRAHDLCMSNEEMTDDEKGAEVLAIRVQQLFVLSSLGMEKEAKALASDISIQDLSDASTKKVAQNNVVAASIDQSNRHMNRRLLNASAVLPVTDKLFTYQEELLQLNSLSLDLQVYKPLSVKKATDTTLSNFQPSTSPYINALSALNAAAYAQGEVAKFGLKKILPLFEKRPFDIGLAMVIIQLYVLTNNHGSAIVVLDKLLSHLSNSTKPADQDVLYAPGLVALQVSLYSSQDRKSQIRNALARAASHWRHKSKPPKTLFQAAGTRLLDSPDPEHQTLAREIFSILKKSDPNSPFATAGFVASQAQLSPSSVTESKLLSLPPLFEQIHGIDIDALEEAGVNALPTPPSTTTSTRKRQLEDAQKPRKKRNRMSKRPKNFDPDKKMDPERWLPLQERSSYRPSKKKGKRKDGERERTQGGVVGSEKVIDTGGEIVKGAEKVGGGGGGGGKGKGKKKGKR